MKLAVIFPGIGYHTDKPLLYYSKKVAAESGYMIKEVKYSNMPFVNRDDKSTILPACEAALRQCKEQLKDIDFSEYEDIVFISKSLGTVAASSYCAENELNSVRHLCFTPVEETFKNLEKGSGIIFHGLNDPWCESSIVYSEYRKLMEQYKLYTFEDANHSLETGEAVRDIQIMQHIVRTVNKYI